MTNEPKKIILHCADTPDYPKGDRRYDSIGAAEIDEWHRSRGFDCIGYHDVIRQTGVIEKGRPIEKIGAHTYGHNTNSIGVCLVGKNLFSKAQIEALELIYIHYKRSHGIGADSWFGHYEFSEIKTCPNIPMDLIRGFFAAKYEKGGLA